MATTLSCRNVLRSASLSAVWLGRQWARGWQPWARTGCGMMRHVPIAARPFTNFGGESVDVDADYSSF